MTYTNCGSHYNNYNTTRTHGHHKTAEASGTTTAKFRESHHHGAIKDGKTEWAKGCNKSLENMVSGLVDGIKGNSISEEKTSVVHHAHVHDFHHSHHAESHAYSSSNHRDCGGHDEAETPVDTTPVNPAPVEPTPVDPAPVDPAPVDTSTDNMSGNSSSTNASV